MTSLSTFSVHVENNLLTVAHNKGNQAQVIALIELESPITLSLQEHAIRYVHRCGRDVQIQIPEDEDPAQLLTLIADTLKAQRKKTWRGRMLAGNCATLLLATAGLAIAFVFTIWSIGIILSFTERQASASIPASHVAQLMPESPKVTPPAATLPRAPSSAPGITAEPAESADIAQDGWTLPASMRAALPVNLQMAAERKLFTVEYSSGHERTLYVFADPECPNCQRLEPALEAAAKEFNVVVFPVTVIGREKSIASITPVLCLPPEQRKAAWSDLFDVGHGMMELGKAQESAAVEPGHCDIAGKALGVNEVAYQTYRIPGTPWAIADDGRHVSQEVLQNPLRLQAFMGAAEVTHAGQ